MFDFCPHCGDSIGQDQQPAGTVLRNQGQGGFQGVGEVRGVRPDLVQEASERAGLRRPFDSGVLAKGDNGTLALTAANPGWSLSV